MKNQQILSDVLTKFAHLSEHDISVGLPYWKSKKIVKGEFFNMQNFIFTDIALIVSGIFRVYYIHPKTKEETNMYFFSENQFLISFRSFIAQHPCYYYIQAMEDSEIISINYENLDYLYTTLTGWATFGRLITELFFSYSQARAEEFMFNSPEERYMKMVEERPDIFNRINAYHISSYLGITNPSLSRIKKRVLSRK